MKRYTGFAVGPEVARGTGAGVAVDAVHAACVVQTERRQTSAVVDI